MSSKEGAFDKEQVAVPTRTASDLNAHRVLKMEKSGQYSKFKIQGGIYDEVG